MRTLLCILVSAYLLPAAEIQSKAATSKNLLTNEGVLLLAEAGVGERFLIELIEGKPSRFDTSAEALAALARQGLTENVLRALVKKQDPTPAPPRSETGEVALEPQLLRGKLVRQRMLIPNATGGDVAILTMVPRRTPGPLATATKERSEERWVLVPPR